MKRKTLQDACAGIRANSVRSAVTGCLEYQGRKDDCGYGWAYYGMKTDRTHRVIWEAANGPIPSDPLACIMHSCDNPCCVELGHLSLGTKKLNAVDMVHKCRSTSQKLTPDDVRDVRLLGFYGASVDDIAESYDVVRTAISRILNGVRWAHLDA